MMSASSKGTTIYLDDDLHKALRLKAIAKSKSVSGLINEAVKESLKRDRKNYNTILEIMSKPVR